MLQIKCFTFGPFETNCYVVSTDEQILLIDPACSNEFERQQLEKYINQTLANNHSPLAIIATHGHLDHLWGAAWATSKWNTPVLMHKADIPMAKAMQSQYNLFGIRRTAEEFPIEPLASNLSPFAIIHTPGHTPGSICLYFPFASNQIVVVQSVIGLAQIVKSGSRIGHHHFRCFKLLFFINSNAL